MKNNNLKGFILAIIAAVLWGFSGTFGQFLFQNRGINVEWLITVRMLVSGILLLAYGKYQEKQNVLQIWNNRKDSIQLLIFSIAGMLAVQYTYFAAIKHSNAPTATVLQFCGPIIIVLYLSIKNRKLPQKKELLAIILAVAGTFLLVTHGNFSTLAISVTALLFGLSSAVALAVYTLQPAKLLNKYNASIVIGWAMLCGSIVFSFVKAPWSIDGYWDLKTYFFIAVIIIFGTLIAFTFYLHSVKIIGGQKASLLASAEPLAATLLAVLWLNTTFSTIDWIGSIFIISTVFLLSKNKEE
ncbi:MULTISPECIES: EamA family transporter [Flavobacterium]|uniref:EamA family transporter n=1 Tax=Flavobacterium TaxID=237 RepID=UPI001182802B|nr:MULTISPECIES: EamA family transporter [Flavobacterium]MCR4033886.1 EamA family transporter [Flavobacterium panacis]